MRLVSDSTPPRHEPTSTARQVSCAMLSPPPAIDLLVPLPLDLFVRALKPETGSGRSRSSVAEGRSVGGTDRSKVWDIDGDKSALAGVESAGCSY